MIGGTCRTHGKMRSASNILVGEPDGKRPPGRPRPRWWENVNWIHLAQDRDQWRGIVNRVMKLWVT